MAKVVDKYANKVSVNLSTTSNDTPLSQEITTGVPIFEKIAFLIHRFEADLEPTTSTLLAAAGDLVMCGLTNSASATDRYYHDNELITQPGTPSVTMRNVGAF